MITTVKFNVYSFSQLEKPVVRHPKRTLIVPRRVRIVPNRVQIVPKTCPYRSPTPTGKGLVFNGYPMST